MKKMMTSGIMLAALTALADEVNPGPDADGTAVTVVMALAVAAGAALLVWLGRVKSRAENGAARNYVENGAARNEGEAEERIK